MSGGQSQAIRKRVFAPLAFTFPASPALARKIVSIVRKRCLFKPSDALSSDRSPRPVQRDDERPQLCVILDARRDFHATV